MNMRFFAYSFLFRKERRTFEFTLSIEYKLVTIGTTTRVTCVNKSSKEEMKKNIKYEGEVEKKSWNRTASEGKHKILKKRKKKNKLLKKMKEEKKRKE